MSTLQDLTIDHDSIERTDPAAFDFHASFKTTDEIHIAVFDIQDTDTNYAYWIRAFDGTPQNPDNDTLANGHISESIDPDMESVVEMILDTIIAARLDRDAETVEEASNGLWERNATRDVIT